MKKKINHIKKEYFHCILPDEKKAGEQKFQKNLRERIIEKEEVEEEEDPKIELFSFLNPPRREMRDISSIESLPLNGFFDWAQRGLPWTAHHAL